MKRTLLTFITVFLLFGLVACGESIEESIIGDWQLIEEGEESNLWKITEDNLTIISKSGETLQSFEYTIVGIEDNEFEFKIRGSESESRITLFEGYFKDKETINSVRYSLGDFELIKVNKEKEEEEVISILANSSEDGESNLYSMGDVDYSILKSWTENVSDENLKYYYPEDGMLMISYDHLGESISDDTVRDEFMSGVKSSLNSFDLIATSEINIEGQPAYRYDFNTVFNNEESTVSLVLIDYHDVVIGFMMATFINSDKDYSSEFEHVLNSIEFIDETR